MKRGMRLSRECCSTRRSHVERTSIHLRTRPHKRLLFDRATDEQAYSREHIDGENIFLKMPEFESECADLFTQGKAVPVTSYVDITPTFAEMPVAP